MGPLEAAVILLAGVGAGAINAIVGSGTLITFPTLIALGYPPLIANVSNSVGLFPGSVAGAIGYRRELRDQGSRVKRLLVFSVLGALTGSLALLLFPPSVFNAVVPALLILAIIAVLLQDYLAARLANAQDASGRHPVVRGAVFGAGIYGGYFGAAQGVILLAILGIAIPDSLQRLNAVKNVLSAAVNLTAGLVFILVSDLDWAVVALIAVGSAAGGWLGGNYGRLLPEGALKAMVVLVGGFALLRLLG